VTQPQIIHWQSEGRPVFPDIPDPPIGSITDRQRPRVAEKISVAVLSTLVSLVPVVPDVVPVFSQEVRTPEVEIAPRPENSPTVFVEEAVTSFSQQIRIPAPEPRGRLIDSPSLIAVPFDAALSGILPQQFLKPHQEHKRPPFVDSPLAFVEEVVRSFPQDIRIPTPEPRGRLIDSPSLIAVPFDAGLSAVLQSQLVLPPPEHRPPVGLLFDTDTGTFPDAAPAVGTPGDNIIMARLPKHEVSRPISIAFEWQTAIQVGGMDETDNSASDITNPDTEIVGTTRNTLKINKLGSFLQFRMSYDDGLSSITDPVIQAFGRFDSGEKWQRLKTLAAAPAIDVTITTAGTDLTDGTDNFTDPNFTAQTVDLNGTDEVTLRVKTALAGTGDATTAFLQAKLVSGIRTF